MRNLTLSAGVVPYVVRSGQPRFLILRAYGYWDFPKGGLEDGESPLQAALRELEEETSLTDVQIKSPDVFYETEAYAAGKRARYYLGEIKSGEVALRPSPELGRPEHHEFRWVEAAEARKLFVVRLRKVLEWAQRQI